MNRRIASVLGLALACLPLALSAQEAAQGPTCDQVFKNIKVFKGVPANDLVPAMEFMSASLKYKCSDCHNPKDYSEDTRGKETARHMIQMQRDINEKNFGGRPQVTCMTCHRSSEHPVGTPVPDGATIRHQRVTNPPKVADLFAKCISGLGKVPGSLTRTGTLTSPFNEGEKITTSPATFVQAADGRFKVDAGSEKFGNDGKNIWRGGAPIAGEIGEIFGRIGRSWRGEHAFDGLDRLTVSGREKLGKSDTVVVRGTRTANDHMEELYFDERTGLLDRFVNITHSSLGNVVTVYDYSNYKDIKGTKVPMKVVATFASGEQMTFDFKSASVSDQADDSALAMSGK